MVINLDGIWDLALDPHCKHQSFPTAFASDAKVALPGSLTENQVGEVPSLSTDWTGSIYDRSWFHDPNLKAFRETEPPHFPFWLTPDFYYVGAAWYQKEFVVPGDMDGIPFELFFERVHWQSKVWVDDVFVGESNSLSVPHRFLGKGLAAGTHRVTIRIDNRIGEINPGPDAHSVSDHTQGNWNGIIGRMELRFLNTSSTCFRSVRVDANPSDCGISISGRLDSNCDISGNIQLQVYNAIDPENVLLKEVHFLKGTADGVVFDFSISLYNCSQWDEFNPHLYQIEMRFVEIGGAAVFWSERIGFRDFKADGTQFSINDRKLFLRGNVDCCVFPLTGYPPMDKVSWAKVFAVQKDMGINHIRFHSWCPPKVAFEVADEIGLYLQVEAPVWPNHGSSVGDGEPVDQFIYDETERILVEYGNHPSFVMYAAGNEPFGDHQVEYLRDFAQFWKEKDARRLYTGASVGTEWPIVDGTDFIVHSRPRGLPWDEERPHSQFDYSDQIAGFIVPFVAHEMGQFCVFPDFDEIEKYTGVYQPKNLEMFKALFLQNFPEYKAASFHDASGRLQLLCYKAEIEASLRTSGFAGVQLLGANDFPGQGTALIGWMNAFYQPKAYAESNYVRTFLGETVLLAKFEKFVFNDDETICIQPGIAHFGPEGFEGECVEWRLLKGEYPLWAGKIDCGDIQTGRYNELEALQIHAGFDDRAVMLEFELRLGDFRNSWNIWVYPNQVESHSSEHFVVLNDCGEAFDQAIEEGRDILLLASESIENGKDVIQYFRPAFWNTSWFQMKPPHTLGLHIEQHHPLFMDFPTRFHSDCQWWELVENQPVANLENFPREYDPIVAPIDTWFFNRRLGMVFEMRCGRSRVLVCTIDLLSAHKKRPVARHFLSCMQNYILGDSFDPQHNIDVAVLKELFEVKDRPVYDCMTDEKPDELIPGKHQ